VIVTLGPSFTRRTSEGSVRLRIAGTDHLVHPGDAVLITAGKPHSVSVVDDGSARLIEIYAPANPDFVLVDE
jgi:quercetin dioxygenase-like cupin family protein